MKVVIFGSKGYLGQYFLSIYPDAFTPSINIASSKEVEQVLDEYMPEVVINCAGKTGRPNVDWCEANKVETISGNVTGPLVLLDECLARGMYLVQLSSGCIYQGDNNGEGYSEEDIPNFDGSFYSRTKTWADQMLKEFPVLNLRLRMPFDGTENPRSLIMKIKNYDKFHDTPNSITYMPDFIAAAKQLIERKAVGIYNIVNPGVSSPYQVMQSYKEIVDPQKSFELLKTENISKVHKTGRSNCILSIKKLESEGISMKPVDKAIKEAMIALIQS